MALLKRVKTSLLLAEMPGTQNPDPHAFFSIFICCTKSGNQSQGD
jgi:hypothetical protein